MPSSNVISRVDQEIQRTKKDLDNLSREMGLLEKHLTALERSRADLAGVILKHAKQPKVQGSASRTALLQEILERAEGPMTMDQIMKELAKRRGHQEDRRLTHATLSYLNRKGVAKSVVGKRGVWQAAA